MWPFKKKQPPQETTPQSPQTPAEGDQEDYVPESPMVPASTTTFKAEWEVSYEEKRKITELRALVPSLPGSMLDVSIDFTLLRFLRARKLNVPAALELYKNAMKWRSENEIDKLMLSADPHEHVFQCICPHRHHGFDKDGHPVYYEKTGQARVNNLLKFMTEGDIVKRHVRYMEYTSRRMIGQSQATGRYIGKQVMVQDLAGMKYTIESTGLKVFKQTTRIDQDFYPETLHRLYIINAPMSFRAVWAVVKPWLDPVTQQKITIVGSAFLPKLKEIISEDNIPASFGGKCTCSGCYANGDQCLSPVRDPAKATQAEIPPPWLNITVANEQQLHAAYYQLVTKSTDESPAAVEKAPNESA